MKTQHRVIIIVAIAALGYTGSYAIRRCTKLLVRREWVEIRPHSDTHDLEIHGTDVGHGKYFDSSFRFRKDPYAIIYYPLWQTELRLRDKYFRHSTIVPNGHDLWESDDDRAVSNDQS